MKKVLASLVILKTTLFLVDSHVFVLKDIIFLVATVLNAQLDALHV